MKFSTTWLVMALICAAFLLFNTSENPRQIGSNIPIPQNNHEQIPDAYLPENPVLKKDHNTSLPKTIVPRSLQAHDRAKFFQTLPFLAPMITASKSDAFTSDVDMDGFADPGDEIEYTVTISNGMGAMDATNLTFTDMVDANTTLVGGSVQASPVSLNDNYTATGNIQITIPAPGVLANDFLGTPTATVTTIANGPTTQGGTVTLNADGSFTYNPPAGYEGDDTFTYTITNSLGNSTATVKITVSGMIWFIDASAAAGDGRLFTPFNSITAFQALNDGMGNHPAAGDNIFIYSGNYTGPITLLNTQRLIGQGASESLSIITGITPPMGSLALPATGGTNPVITTAVAATNAITLGMNNLIRGLTVGNTTGHKIIGNNFGTVTIGNAMEDVSLNGTGPALSLTTGTLAGKIDELTSASGGNNVLLNTVAGTLNPASGTITSNAAGAAFSVNGSNPTITYPGTISKTGSTGDVVSIANTTGNTNIMFSAAVSGDNSSTGVTLSNANSNVTFLSITLGNSGARLTNIPIEINGGGSSNTYNLGVVSAFSNNTTTFSATNADGTINCSSTSTLDATNGPAINIDGPVGLTTLGLTFVSVNVSTSLTNGITIKDTNGNFTINGTGTTDGSGGTLQNISNRGIELSGMTTMTSITLKNLTLNNANTVDSGSGCDNSSNTGCNAAIHLNGVTNLTLDNVVINGATEQGINGISVSNLMMNECTVTNGGAASSALDVGEDNVRLVGLSGTCSISNCIFSFPARKNFAVLNTDVNLNQITFSNCTFSDTQGRPFNFGDSGIEFDLIGNSTTNIDVDNCTFTRHKTEGIQVLPSTNGTMTTLDIEGCSFDNDPSNIVDGRAIELFPDGTSVLKFNIANNTKIKGKGGPLITMNAEDNTVVDGFITGNNTTGGKSGIIGGGTGSPGSAILISAQENCSARIQVENNVISNVGGLDNTILAEALGGTGNLHVKILNNTITTESRYINIQSGVSGDLGTNTVCAHIANNACSGTTSTTIVRGRQVTAGHTLQFQGAGAGAMETDRLANNWNTNSNTPVATAATVSTGVATMFNYGATCSPPSYTPSIVADPVAEMITDNTVIDPTEGEVTTTTVESEDIENIAKTPSTPEEEPITQAAVKPDKGSNSPVEKMAPDVTVGPLTLPEGKNVIIKFRVTVNTPPLANCQISNQGLVMFDGGSVMTDDPAVGGATDPTVTPFNPLVADFNGTPLTGCVPLEVNFTDASTSGGTVNSWAWDVDNNSITDYTTQNPMHTYTTPGMYTVKLTVMDNLGCTDTETKTNYVNAAEPEVNIAVAPMSVPENMGTPLVFTVTRTGSTDCELTVPFTIMGTATNGTDYPLVSTLSFTIPAGMTTAMLSITPTDDNIVEANETIIVTLTDGANYSVGMNNLATGTITNDDQATLSINSVSNAEGDMGTQTYTFTVTSDKAVDVPFTVNVNTVDGTATVGDADYVNNSTTLNFAGTVGETQTFDVTVNGDMKVEPNETFTVPLSMVAASGRNVVISGIQGTGTGTITNDDAATISIDDVMMAEGDAGTTNFIFTVSLSKVVSTAVTVNFTTADGTATLANLDYNMNSNSITFPANGAGQSQTITVQVVGDVFGEPNETFFVNLTSIQGNPPNISFADAQGLGTILDDDLSFSINDVTLAEGDAGTTNFTFTVTRTSTATVESIDFTTANNTATTGDNDYVLNSGTLNFAIGDNSETITVVVNGDMKVELDETFFVNLSNQSNGSIADAQGLGTITNDDQATLSVSSVSNPEGDMGTQTYTFTVTLDKEVDVPFMVDINANDGTATQPSDYLPNSATLNFAGTAGETETFDVTVNGDMIVEPNETFVVGLHSLTVTGRNIVLGPAGTGTITNDDAATITIDDVTMMEGDAGTVNFVFSVTLSKVVSTAVSVDFIATGVTAASGVDFNPNSGTVIFPANGAGQTQTITVQVIGDVMGEANETFTVDLSNIVGSPSVTFADAQGLGTILDDDLAFSINDVTLSEGNAGTTNFTFTVTRTSTATAESIQYATADNTATTGDNDYVSTNGTLNFAIGDDSETISVTINGDLKVEPNETFFVNLSNASMGAIADGQGVGTINNDDAAVVHLTLLDAIKNEGTGGTTDFTFKATLDNPVQDGFDLAFTVTDGTATDADDYDVITTSPLSFTGTANEMQIITVRVNADAKVEADETFDVTIEDSGFSNTALAASLSTASTVTATIQNDDAATIFISDVTKLEGISGPTLYTFGVVLSADVQGGVMVDFMTADNTATAPSDYSSFMGTLSFDGTLGEIKTLTHIVNGDCMEEADETFFMNLSNIVAAVEPGAITFLNNDNQGIGTIQNDDATYVGGIIYVDENAAGLNNGADWTNAFNDLQDALRVACTCGVGQIWVADGTYYPDQGVAQTDNARSSTFQLCNGVAVYGGFAGGEANLSDRDVFTNIAILSGDLMQNDGANFANNGDNAYHVVTGSGTNMTARLDGFTITAGNANGVTQFDARGGGMYNNAGSPCISNCSFVSNAARDGAGMANDDSSPAITNCSFLGNQATQSGGGMYNTDGSPTVTNCIFSGNVATGDPVPNAGGMYNNSGANPIITNSTFSGNSTSGNGGGIYNSAATSTLINTIIWNNQDQSGIGMANSSIDGDPSTFTYSLIQNITTNDANGNKDGVTTAGDANYPDFVMPLAPGLNTGGDYRLQITSPAIDMGDDASVPADSKDVDDDGDIAESTPDRDLNDRIVGAMVDMGAYEFPCASEAGEIANEDLTICQGDDPGTIFTASGAQNDAEYSFAFILASGNDILAYNTSGDFDLSVLTPGIYTVYGLSYATFNTPASVTDYLATVTTIAEIIADDTDNGGTLCLDLTDAGEGQTATIIVNEPATASLIDAYPTICRTKVVQLSELQGAIGGSATSATWSVLEGDSDGVFSPGNVFGTATTFKPGANDAKRGYVTIVLKTNDPDGTDGPCPPAMDMIRIIVKNVDCGTFPWNGNE